MVYGRLMSAWPALPSVLVHDGAAYAAAGLIGAYSGTSLSRAGCAHRRAEVGAVGRPRHRARQQRQPAATTPMGRWPGAAGGCGCTAAMAAWWRSIPRPAPRPRWASCWLPPGAARRGTDSMRRCASPAVRISAWWAIACWSSAASRPSPRSSSSRSAIRRRSSPSPTTGPSCLRTSWSTTSCRSGMRNGAVITGTKNVSLESLAPEALAIAPSKDKPRPGRRIPTAGNLTYPTRCRALAANAVVAASMSGPGWVLEAFGARDGGQMLWKSWRCPASQPTTASPSAAAAELVVSQLDGRVISVGAP